MSLTKQNYMIVSHAESENIDKSTDLGEPQESGVLSNVVMSHNIC